MARGDTCSEAFVFKSSWLDGLSCSNYRRSGGGGGVGLSSLDFVLSIAHLKHFGSVLGEEYKI